MLKNDKIEWIWNYVKEAKRNGFWAIAYDMDYESLNNESDEFLDIVIEDICEYEEWDLNEINK